MRRIVKMLSLLFFVLCSILLQPAISRQLTPEQAVKLPTFEAEGDVDKVNSFLSGNSSSSRSSRHRKTVRSGTIHAHLLTPLNSNLSFTGDPVKAVVDSSADKDGNPWLPPGTQLEGCVEAARKANFGKTDGAIAIRFYLAKVGSRTVELALAPDSAAKDLQPSHNHKYTKKEQVRGVLMMATRIAVPMAIGSGGMSLAITTGAGAVIGGVLAEKGQHMRGAAIGAWQGSGLSMLDPIVRKGQTVVLAEGAPVQLQLADSIIVPRFSRRELLAAEDLQTKVDLLSKDGGSAQLSTSAHLIDSAHRADSSKALTEISKFLDQANLAEALRALRVAEAKFPGDPDVQAMHARVFALISGSSETPAAEVVAPNQVAN